MQLSYDWEQRADNPPAGAREQDNRSPPQPCYGSEPEGGGEAAAGGQIEMKEL